MVNCFEEHYGNEVCRVNLIVIIYNAVSDGEAEVFYREKTEHIGSKEFAVIHGTEVVTISVYIVEGACAVE